MACERCSGMMIADRLHDEGGRAANPVWRCLTCGDLTDPVILANRKKAPRRARALPKARHFAPAPSFLRDRLRA